MFSESIPLRPSLEKTAHSRIDKHLILSLLLVGSMGLNLLLGYEVRDLRIHFLLPVRTDVATVVGASVFSLQASDTGGRPIRIDFSSQPKPTVLYVLNPKCHWCARNVDNIKALAKLAGDRYRFLGLSLDEGTLKEYAKSQQLGFPIYSISSYGMLPQLELGGTPETIVVSENGKVLRAWLGGLTGDELKDVEKYFAVSLPGLTPELGNL
jgi:hypothetical protein